MPRNCRPSWVQTKVDSGATKGTGPKGRAGTLKVEVLVRRNGSPFNALRVECCGIEDRAKVRTTVTLQAPFTTEIAGERVTLPIGTILGLTTEQ